MELVGIALSAVAAIAGLIAAVASIRQLRHDSLARHVAKEQACKLAIAEIMNTPWVFMSNGVKEQAPTSEHEHRIRTQRHVKLRMILEEAYQDV